MGATMVIGYHLILSMYGFWLPNDPRGSWSDFVRSWELFRAAGPATKAHSRRSMASTPHDVYRRHTATAALQRPPMVLTGAQAAAIGDGIGRFLCKAPFSALACAMLRQHAHLVITRAPYSAEQAVNLLKGAAARELLRHGVHPFGDETPPPMPWTKNQWICYLNSDADILRCVRYVESKLTKGGLPPQRWRFVQSV